KYPSVVGKVWAKSGTITRVRAYSGYAISAEGRLLAFSVIANNFLCTQSEIRKKMESFIAELVK
ncbi:MAG TPA: D-alanyl-D-alanine carboxypeptidase, partial [Allocoleopsis sp.]